MKAFSSMRTPSLYTAIHRSMNCNKKLQYKQRNLQRSLICLGSFIFMTACSCKREPHRWNITRGLVSFLCSKPPIGKEDYILKFHEPSAVRVGVSNPSAKLKEA